MLPVLTELSLTVRMRSLGAVSFTFLSWFLVEVNSQTFPYASFMGQTLANHSYVDLSLVGRPDHPGSGRSVKCHTDLTTCCSDEEGTVICYFFGVEIFSDGALRPKFCYANR